MVGKVLSTLQLVSCIWPVSYIAVAYLATRVFRFTNAANTIHQNFKANTSYSAPSARPHLLFTQSIFPISILNQIDQDSQLNRHLYFASISGMALALC